MGSSAIRRAVRYIAVSLAVIVLFPVASEFFIELARERGIYDQPSKTVAGLLDCLQTITGHPVFPWIAGAVVGLALGLWLDIALRRMGQWLVQRSKTPLEFSWTPRLLQHFNGVVTSTLILRCNSRVAVTDVEVRYIDDDSSRFGLTYVGSSKRVILRTDRLTMKESREFRFFRYIPAGNGDGKFLYEDEKLTHRVRLPFTRHVSLGAFANEASIIAAFDIQFDKAGKVSVSPSTLFDENGLYTRRYKHVKETALPIQLKGQ